MVVMEVMVVIMLAMMVVVAIKPSVPPWPLLLATLIITQLPNCYGLLDRNFPCKVKIWIFESEIWDFKHEFAKNLRQKMCHKNSDLYKFGTTRPHPPTFGSIVLNFAVFWGLLSLFVICIPLLCIRLNSGWFCASQTMRHLGADRRAEGKLQARYANCLQNTLTEWTIHKTHISGWNTFVRNSMLFMLFFSTPQYNWIHTGIPRCICAKKNNHQNSY